MLPAYAGMIRSGWSSPASCTCAPRVCGDDPVAWPDIPEHSACSPRMRG